MKKIGIIGAGFVGSSLARQFIKNGHQVKIANSRGVETLKGIEKQTGAKAVSLDQVAIDIDVLFIAIPLGQIPKLQKTISLLSENIIVVDTGNYYPPRDGSIKEIEEGLPETEWVSRQLKRSVAKAFNNIIAYGDGFIVNRKPKGSVNRIALPIAADDINVRREVMELVEEFGFTAYDAGALSESWRQQSGQPAYCTNPTESELSRLLKKAVSPQKAFQNQAKSIKIMEKIPQDYPIDGLVRASRLMAGLDIFNPKSWWEMIKLGIAILR